jgi:hypothetical protein
VRHLADVLDARGWPECRTVVGVLRVARLWRLGHPSEKVRAMGRVAVVQRRLVAPWGHLDLVRSGLPLPADIVHTWLAAAPVTAQLADEGYAITSDRQVYAWRRLVPTGQLAAAPQELWPVRIRHVNAASGALTPVCDRPIDVRELADAARDLVAGP